MHIRTGTTSCVTHHSSSVQTDVFNPYMYAYTALYGWNVGVQHIVGGTFLYT